MFNAEYRHIIYSDLPEATRYLKFRHCVGWYCWLTRQKFQETYLRLGEKYGFDSSKKPDRMQIVEAATCLKDEREAFLEKLKEFRAVRCKQKAKGQRIPSRRQIRELYSPDWI